MCKIARDKTPLSISSVRKYSKDDKDYFFPTGQLIYPTLQNHPNCIPILPKAVAVLARDWYLRDVLM